MIKEGAKFGRYEIMRKIGAGGMGEVYLAEDTKLDRRVALKILPETLAQDGERMRRFVREAKSTSALNHPNIITIYEIGESDNKHFIASEYIEGETLHSGLKTQPLNLEIALNIAIQVASALDAAHRAGIIHRDVKPENVMIRPDGLAKLLDFGIAKLTERKTEPIDAEASTAIKASTTPGMIIGTANYMSPEQARGKEIDVRTDIFSFGVMLYEMLAGKLPFEGESALDVIGSILHKEFAPLSRTAPDAPRELQRIVEKCLRKDREERYQTAKDLLIDLKDVRQDLQLRNQLERTASVNREESKTQILNATTSDVAHTTSSAEYVLGEIKSHKGNFAIALSILLLTAIGLGYWYFAGRPTKQIESIAVMPFVNESGNADTEYLSDGMTETLINSLSQLPRLSVKARSSVFHYKGKTVNPRTVGSELNVQAILNGRVVQRGDNLLLSLELVDAQTGNQIWGEQYNRKWTELVSLQSEIARDVSNKLRAKLSSTEQQQVAKSYTANPEAYRLYLKGRYHWNKREDKEFIKALEYFQQAIDKDPTYALAYVGLADSYLLGDYGNLSRWEKVSKAKAAAQKALEIDATLGEAHTTLANIKHWDDWNWEEAEKEYKLAIELSPNYATAHHWYAESLSAVGRFDESFAEYKRALELDPLSLAISTDLGLAYYLSRQYDRAIEHLKKLRETDPNYVRTHFYLARVYEQKGMFEEAISEYEKGFILEGDNPNDVAKDIASLRSSFKVGGAKGYWQKILDRTIEGQERGDFDGKFLFLRVKQLPFDIARLYAHLGERYEAFRWLEKAYQERNGELAELKVAPEWDNLRSDSRFQDLLRRVGLP